MRLSTRAIPAIVAVAVAGAGGAAIAAEPDWQKAEAELREILAEIVAIDTRNPPGNEIEACRALQVRLEREGIATEIVEPEPGRGSLIARLPGSAKKRPLLLLGHVDVVGVQRESWDTDPLTLVERDGFLYGRGVIDDKGMVAAEALTLLLLKRSGEVLDRDIIFLAEADEESGGEFGVRWLLAHRPELVDAEYAVNEGGRIVLGGDGVAWVGLQNAEKRSISLRLIAHGSSGHASMPRPDNPVARLARAIARLEASPFPVRLTPETEVFFPAVAASHPPEMARAMRAITDPERAEEAAQVLSRDLMYGAMIRNTISPTMLEAGFRSNVIPATAEGVINLRLLPGEDLEEVLRAMREAIGDDGVEIAFLREPSPEAPGSPFEGPVVDAVRRAADRHFPGAPVVPLLSTGATDSAALRRAGIPAYGLLVFPLTRDDAARMHGDNERMPVSSLGAGLRLLYDIAREAAR